MSNLLLNPQYCPEDKDVLDFINSASVSLPELVAFLRKRGVYVSQMATKDDLAKLISDEVYTWTDVEELLALLTAPLKKEHYVHANHKTDVDFDSVKEAVDKVKTFRLQKYGDRIGITSSGSGRYTVSIEYTQIDYEKTRLIQSVERDAQITIEKTANGFITRRSADKCARDVELAILGELEQFAKSNDQVLKTERILLSQFPGVASKVKFFTDLMEGLAGYRFQEIKSMRVQSAKVDSEIHDAEEDDPVAKAYAGKIESLIISGNNVGGTDLYEKYVGKDFFPLSSTWIAVSDTDECRKVELHAAFAPELKDHEFQCSIAAVWLQNGDSLEPKSKPSSMVSARFADLLRKSAEGACAKQAEESKKA